jgi:hypothetical protein
MSAPASNSAPSCHRHDIIDGTVWTQRGRNTLMPEFVVR